MFHRIHRFCIKCFFESVGSRDQYQTVYHCIVMEDKKCFVHVVDTFKPSKLSFGWIFDQVTLDFPKQKVVIIACPTAELCRFLTRKYQLHCGSEIQICCGITDVIQNVSTICIVPFSIASSEKCLTLSDDFWIIDGHSMASYEHFASVNRLLTQLSIMKKNFTILLDNIPALNEEHKNLSEQLISRYNAKYTCLPYQSFNNEVVVECSMECVDVVLGELQYYEGQNRSECPLTDTLLSIISGCLREDKRIVVVCGNDAEAKDIAERIDAEFHQILMKQQLPNARTALSVSLKTIGGVVFVTSNPFFDKDDGFFEYINSKRFSVIVGSKKRLLYTCYEADIVINVIFTGNEKALLDSEYSSLFNLTLGLNSSVITITDSVIHALSRFEYQPRLFNKTIINLISSMQIRNMNQLSFYVENCFINDFDYCSVVRDLCQNGAIFEAGGEFEVLRCQFLSGYYATEKIRLLSEAAVSLNLKDLLYVFFLANVYFVDASETLSLPRSTINLLFSDPEIKELCERVKLHDPKIRGNHYLKLESSILISSILYKYFNNVQTAELIAWINDTDRLNVFLILNQQNFRKTYKIAQDISSSFAVIFKHLESICSQFNVSSLKQIRGLDFETVDTLISNGVKSVRDFIHSKNLEGHLRSLANKRAITVRALFEELRNEALSTQKPLKRLSLNSSCNTSRDIFSSSNVGEEIVITNLCVQNVPNLCEVFAIPLKDDAIIMCVKDENSLNVMHVGKEISVYEYILNCCGECEKGNGRLNEILDRCCNSNFYVTNIIDVAESFASADIPLDIILKANCLTALCYVIGPEEISHFVKNCTSKIKTSWQFLFQSITSKSSFSQEFVYCIQSLMSSLIPLNTLSQLKMVQQAFSVLAKMYEYGIPYSGHSSLMKKFKEKISSMPPDVVKIANSKFISPEFHNEFADNCDLLLKAKRSKHAKLVSSDVATSEQSDIIYTQLSQIRKLNQAIDLLKVRCFADSGIVRPRIDFGGHGRLYTYFPNLQNFAKKLPFQDLPSPRSIICATEDRDLWSADFREIELRVVAALSQDSCLLEALKSSNTFEYIAEKLELSDFPRPNVKLFFYGLLYGMGPNTLVEQYKFERDEATSLWNRFSETFAELDRYRNFLSEEVKQRKLLTNYFGIPVTVESAFSAINAVIQSTAACILLQAVGNFSSDENGIRLLFTVHDEIIFDAPTSLHGKVPEIVNQYMQNEIEGIPLPIKLSVGKSWDDLKTV